jgi:hypothetical protein
MNNQTGKERRLKPRYAADVTCTVALAEPEYSLLFPNEKLHCRTRDVSESGLGLVSNSIYLGYTCVVDEGRVLLVSLELPAGALELEATPAHYVRLADAGASATTYLIGLRIGDVSVEARAAYAAFLDSLAEKAGD